MKNKKQALPVSSYLMKKEKDGRDKREMKTRVLYKSRTGNTEKLAKAIFEAVPGRDKDIASLEEGGRYDQGELYFIGFGRTGEAPA